MGLAQPCVEDRHLNARATIYLNSFSRFSRVRKTKGGGHYRTGDAYILVVDQSEANLVFLFNVVL